MIYFTVSILKLYTFSGEQFGHLMKTEVIRSKNYCHRARGGGGKKKKKRKITAIKVSCQIEEQDRKAWACGATCCRDNSHQ